MSGIWPKCAHCGASLVLRGGDGLRQTWLCPPCGVPLEAISRLAAIEARLERIERAPGRAR